MIDFMSFFSSFWFLVSVWCIEFTFNTPPVKKQKCVQTIFLFERIFAVEKRPTILFNSLLRLKTG